MNVDGLTPTQMVDIMIKFQITAKQFLLLFILETDRLEEKGNIVDSKGGDSIQNIYRIASHLDEKWTFEEIDDLIEKGLIVDHSSRVGARSSLPDNYVVTDLFTSSVMSDMTNFEEFWELYPGFCDNFQDFRGPKVPLKAVDYEEVERLYLKYVRTKPMHALVMKVLQWAIDTNQVNMSIQKYVASKMWDQHRLLRRASSSSKMTKSIHGRK